MAEHVVKDVGLFEVVELVCAADELSGREAPMREVLEEHLVGDQARHGDDLPAGVSHQHFAQLFEMRDAIGRYRQRLHADDELVARAPM